MNIKGHFTDEKHDCDIIIRPAPYESDWDMICNIDGIDFGVENLQWLALDNSNNAEEASAKFRLLRIGGDRTCYGGKIVNYSYGYLLQRYSMYMEIPTVVIDIEDNSEKSALISFSIKRTDGSGNKNCIRICDNKEVYTDTTTAEYFSLAVGSEIFEADSPSGYYGDYCRMHFESAFKSICKKIQHKYRLKCCFGCDYADYNPYYDSDFGEMHCWREYPGLHKISKWKHNYNTDDNFRKIHHTAETDICSSFRVRESDTEGVRGKIYDY